MATQGELVPFQVQDFTELRQEAIDRDCSGLVSGGAISISATPGKIDVAPGIGLVVDHVSIGQRVVFAGGLAQSPAGNGTNYVHIKPDGTVEISFVKAVTDRIYLGHAFVAAGVVIDVFPVPEWAGHFGARVNEWVAHAVGALVADGMGVSEDGADPLALRVADGEFYSRLGEYDFDATSNFAKLFNSSDLSWQPDGDAPNHANTSQWNDVTRPNATALQNLTAGWWKKDLLVAAPSGKVYYIFAQSQWATEDEAILAAFPVLPSRVSADLVPLAGFVVKQGDATVAAGIIDVRPNLARIFGFGSGASATTLDHGTLAGLADDDHGQYQLRTERGAALGYPELDAGGKVPVAQVDYAAVVPTARTLTAGNGLTGGGDLTANRTFAVSADADGSILVGAGGVKVAVLATDAQHGNRGGGGLHADAIPGGASGFMTGAEKTKLANVPAAVASSALTLTAGSGLSGGGDLTANRTFAVAPHADGSILAGVGGTQVGVLATDAQHGARGGGNQHAAAIPGVSDGFLSAADATKLASVAANATNTPLSDTPPVAVTRAAAAQGAAAEAARQDHKHDTSGLAYAIFAQTANVVASLNGTQQTLVGAGLGSVTLPANFFSAGKSLRIEARGFYTRAQNTLRVRLYLGGMAGTAVLDTGPIAPGNVTAMAWSLEANLTCRTAGAPGSIMCQGSLTLNTSSTAAVIWQLMNVAATAVTTTGALDLDLTALWAGNGNSFTCTNLIATAMN